MCKVTNCCGSDSIRLSGLVQRGPHGEVNRSAPGIYLRRASWAKRGQSAALRLRPRPETLQAWARLEPTNWDILGLTSIGAFEVAVPHCEGDELKTRAGN